MSLSDEPSSPVEPSPARREPLVSAPPADTEVHAEASRARPAIVVLVLFAAVFALVVVGARPRLTQRAAVEKAHAAANAPRRVRVAKAKAGSPLAEVKLPATSAPLRTTSLFAKTSGFLRKNYVEVGDVVKASQPLADIDSRETDQELALAEARVGEAQANIGLALGTSQRNADLAKLGVVSKQQADDTRALANSATAALKIRQLDVERLRAMRSSRGSWLPSTAPSFGATSTLGRSWARPERAGFPCSRSRRSTFFASWSRFRSSTPRTSRRTCPLRCSCPRHRTKSSLGRSYE